MLRRTGAVRAPCLHVYYHTFTRLLASFRTIIPRPLRGVCVPPARVSRPPAVARYGGLYADVDVAPCDALGPTASRFLAERWQLVLVREPPRYGTASTARKGTQRVSNFFMAGVPGHPFWRHAADLLRSRAHLSVISSTGPHFFSQAYASYLAAARRAGCLGAVRDGSMVFEYEEFQRSVGAHHHASTWHFNGTATHEPRLEAWIGVNRSLNCPEADFGGFIRAHWRCRHLGHPCPRPDRKSTV